MPELTSDRVGTDALFLKLKKIKKVINEILKRKTVLRFLLESEDHS